MSTALTNIKLCPNGKSGEGGKMASTGGMEGDAAQKRGTGLALSYKSGHQFCGVLVWAGMRSVVLSVLVS